MILNMEQGSRNPHLFKKEEVKLVVFGIVASSYTLMAYDIIQELFKVPIDLNILPVKTAAGVISMFIGIAVIAYLTKKKTN
jgi:hypothetical protein